MLNINITESAQKYLAELLEKQDTKGIGIRIFVSDPGTPKAETCIAYCRPGEEKEDDIIIFGGHGGRARFYNDIWNSFK